MKIISIIMVLLLIFLTSGCADNKIIDGIEYETYGLIDKDDVKNQNIEYDFVWGNLIWGIILIETIVAPIYFWGFSMWEPIGKKQIKN